MPLFCCLGTAYLNRRMRLLSYGTVLIPFAGLALRAQKRSGGDNFNTLFRHCGWQERGLLFETSRRGGGPCHRFVRETKKKTEQNRQTAFDLEVISGNGFQIRAFRSEEFGEIMDGLHGTSWSTSVRHLDVFLYHAHVFQSISCNEE